MSDLPRRVEIHEEAPREGFQIEPGPISLILSAVLAAGAFVDRELAFEHTAVGTEILTPGAAATVLS